MNIIINDRCPFQYECGKGNCKFYRHERDCGYYQGNAHPDAEIRDQAEAMEAEWEARMTDTSVLTDQPAPAAHQETETAGGVSSLVLLPVDKLLPHPDNPRKDLGDLQELADSIKANGVLQNLTVVSLESEAAEWSALSEQYREHPTEEVRNLMNRITANQPKDREGLFRVVIGNRRLAAAKLAGLKKVPCVIMEMGQREQLQTMLLENMQRSDLTAYEQAQGFQMMLDLGDSVEEIAEKSGFSQTTVRRRVKLLELDAEKFKKAEKRGATIQDYLELNQIQDLTLRNQVLDAIGTNNFKAELKRAKDHEFHVQRMAQWEKDLDSFALKIKKRGCVGEESIPMEYVRSYGHWSHKNTAVEKPEDAGEVRYYYRIASDQIDLFRDKQEHQETEEERQRKELETYNRKIQEELGALTKRHYELRYEFISGFKSAKTYTADICRYAAGTIIGDGRWSQGCVDVNVLTGLLDLDINDDMDYSALQALVAPAAEKNPEYVLLACAYASVDSDNEGYWAHRWNNDLHINECTHARNDELDRLYDFLLALGYELSDEEQALRDGTHELFQNEEGVAQ